MKVLLLFFRQTGQLFLCIIRIAAPILFLLALLYLTGCGEEDLEIQHYNPVSPLPLRIDVTVTPTPDSASSRTQNLGNQEEISDEEVGQNTPTPFPATQSIETPTPGTEEDSESSNPSTQPTPTPTSTPLKKETEVTPSPTPKKQNILPTPTPIAARPEPTKTPKPPKSISEDSSKIAEEDKNPLPAKQMTAKQTDEQTLQPAEKVEPMVTPYNLTIDKLEVCSKISNRNPVNCGNEFSLSEVNRVYTWMRVTEVEPPKIVKHVYYWKGALVATVKLRLKYASMRTWSQKTFKPEQALGKWKVVITTEKDEVIAVKEFTVVR